MSISALKEWYPVIHECALGTNMVLFRRGGILDKRFDPRISRKKRERYLFFPTSFHVTASGRFLKESVESGYRDTLDLSLIHI